MTYSFCIIFSQYYGLKVKNCIQGTLWASFAVHCHHVIENTANSLCSSLLLETCWSNQIWSNLLGRQHFKRFCRGMNSNSVACIISQVRWANVPVTCPSLSTTGQPQSSFSIMTSWRRVHLASIWPLPFHGHRLFVFHNHRKRPRWSKPSKSP